MTFNISEILGILKKVFWAILILFIIFNVIIFHYFSGGIYLLLVLLGNPILFYITIFLGFIIGKKYLKQKGSEIIENINKDIEENIDIQEAKIIEDISKK